MMAVRALLLLFLGATACGSQSPTQPRLVGEGRRILFIGNSLTYVNDLPGIVQALADSAGGDRLAVEANRDSLRIFSARFATEIAKVKARPALYSVWPTAGRRQDFARAIESYTLAAADMNGLLFPVASARLRAWQRDANLQLYAPDGLHPSATGSYLAALVVYARILNRSPVGLPARLRLRSGTVIAIEPETAAMLQQVAAAVARA